MAMGNWDTDAEQWNADTDAWDYAYESISFGITAGQTFVSVSTSQAPISQSITGSDSYVPVVGVLETFAATWIMDSFEAAAASISDSLGEGVDVETSLIFNVDNWEISNGSSGNQNWTVGGSRSDVWSKSGGTSSDWQGDVPL